MRKYLDEARKFVVAIIGALAQVAAAGALPERYKAWAAVIIATATALGVYHIPNERPQIGEDDAS